MLSLAATASTLGSLEFTNLLADGEVSTTGLERTIVGDCI